ncbi:MAG: transposase, partial [Nitrosomonas sp.]|nr:transposase [Nitrosomonas sp.]
CGNKYVGPRRKERAMFPVVERPKIVEHYAKYYAKVFSPAALIQFERYISGLLVLENKSVEGINRLCVFESRNQSSLNRLLTESPFSLAALNEARLAMMNSVEEMRIKGKGVLSIDDTLLSHHGKHFDEIAYLYDSAQGRYVWAHNLVTLHYSDEQTDYPVYFELWRPVQLEQLEQGLLAAKISLRESKQSLKQSAPAKWRQYLLGVWRRHQNKPEVAALYDSKLRIAERLLADWVQAHPGLKLPVAFDSWYTQPSFCHYLDQALHLPYVGTLTEDAQVVLQTGMEKVSDFAERLKQEQLSAVQPQQPAVFRPITIAYKGDKELYYSYCATHRIHNFGKVRLVINHRRADLADKPVYYITNQLNWQAAGITRIRRHRWPVEVFHEEGKAEGLDQYQLRDFTAIERHVALVAVVYCLLRTAQHDQALHHKLHCELKFDLEGSAAFWRRATQAQSLWALALFISTGLAQGHSLQTLMTPLLRTVCAL